jgi:DNA invertase Pin-like site-specific DNA recombinase
LTLYYRVSTNKQKRSGLGLKAQRRIAHRYAKRCRSQVLAEFKEVESGRKCDRPQLAQAVATCRATGATLVVAKLDRLARDTRFILQLLDSNIPLHFCDLPQVKADDPITGRLLVTVMAALAEFEAKRIAQRIKEALAEKKRQGAKLGAANPRCRGFLTDGHPKRCAGSTAAVESRRRKAGEYLAAIRPILKRLMNQGCTTYERLAAALNAGGYKTQTGKPWTVGTVFQVLRVREWEARS